MTENSIARWAADLIASANQDPYDQRLRRAAEHARRMSMDMTGTPCETAELVTRGERLRRRLIDMKALPLAHEVNDALTALTLAGE